MLGEPSRAELSLDLVYTLKIGSTSSTLLEINFLMILNFRLANGLENLDYFSSKNICALVNFPFNLF